MSEVPPRPDLSVVVPVYDEAESLPALADEIRAALGGLTFEVWLVDDGSTDESWAVIERLQAEDIRFGGVRFRRNYGKSAALAAGFARCQGRFIATLDADLQDDPAELPEMVARLEGGADLVSGWKRERNDPWEKRLPSKFFNWVTRVVSGIPLHDFNSGIKAYRAEVVQSVRVYGELHRYIPLLAKWEGYTRIEEQKVNHRPRVHGRTKFGIERYLRGFLDLITVVFITRFARRPMMFFGGAGTVAFLVGFLMLAYLTVLKVAFGEPIGGRPLLTFGVLLILLGAQSFLAGFLGEMIVRPEMERADRYDVREETAPPTAGRGGVEHATAPPRAVPVA
ncbi:glycosyltransferase family 2 protein [Rubrivirga sp. S365]|uniref:Glycosyltransferase family 2 protein n=1 Tax=Rubrivirga litoralis TaxID=3075598 RepID=A0ABU3BLM9_9BACT|nr:MULTISPECIES: glycosyltransferase family 2 protein [unclassified Rubrivirga]MDT0630191.1 glycosyltransferase family 2 protein [Rubrivirga sp. F394]MDT7855702.1 glycosyltransferase family 2 protein [Rubrivirga sp. S365]